MVSWNVAILLMHAAEWCTRIRIGAFACTPHSPLPGPIVEIVTKTKMSNLIRHGFECTHHVNWRCTPNQIGKVNGTQR